MESYVWYIYESIILLYADNSLTCSTSKDTIGTVNSSLNNQLKIEDESEVYKYIGIDLDHLHDGTIYLHQPLLTQITIYLIPGMDKSSTKTTPEVNIPLINNQEDQARNNDFNNRSVIELLSFFTN